MSHLKLTDGLYAMISPYQILLAATLLAASAFADEVGWKPLWNGKTLEGWHQIGKGEWKAEDGQIVGRHAANEKEYTHLVTDAVYGDFTARFKFKSLAGNSGFYFRIDEDPAAFSGVRGFQAEIDPQKDVGGLYETNGRSWVVQPTPEQVSKFYKPGEWNEMSVIAKGAKIIVTVNGQTTAEIDDPQGRKQGHIALQLHGGQEGLIYFKDLQLQGEPVQR